NSTLPAKSGMSVAAAVALRLLPCRSSEATFLADKALANQFASSRVERWIRLAQTRASPADTCTRPAAGHRCHAAGDDRGDGYAGSDAGNPRDASRRRGQCLSRLEVDHAGLAPDAGADRPVPGGCGDSA